MPLYMSMCMSICTVPTCLCSGVPTHECATYALMHVHIFVHTEMHLASMQCTFVHEWVGMCIHMCTGMCTNMCTGMYTDMHTDMHADMCVDMSNGMYTDMHVGMCADMCIGMCADMCTDMCADACADMCTDMLVYKIACVPAYLLPHARLCTCILTSSCICLQMHISAPCSHAYAAVYTLLKAKAGLLLCHGD